MTTGGPGEAAGDAPAVWMLATGQTLGYACLVYIFAALVTDLHTASGWSLAFLALGPSLAILCAALAAPFAGRAVDAGFGPELMSFGAIFGALALVGLSFASTPAAYLAAWVAIGLAQGACLYEVCFAWLIRRLGDGARGAIIRVTLLAGLASTLAFPAGALMAQAMGWEGAVRIAALVMALGTAPLHHWAGRRLRRRDPAPRGRQEGDRGGLVRAARRPAFWGLAGIFFLVNLDHWMIVHLLLPLLAAKGVAPGLAVLAAACIGPAQVLGRLALMAFERRVSVGAVSLATMAGLVVAAALLLSAGAGPELVLAFAAVQGAAMGVVTILRPLLVEATLGRAGYGAVAGAISIAPLTASAAAPLLGAVLLAEAGPVGFVSVALGLAVLALAGVAVLRIAMARTPPEPPG